MNGSPAPRVLWQRPDFSFSVPVLVIGAGAAGLIAALAARECGAGVLVVERDRLPRGSTALSAGLIPAAGTRWQAEAGIADTVEDLAGDIVRKAGGEPDRAAVSFVAAASGRALEWLADAHGLPFSVVTNFRYPGHSAHRMHGLPTRSGEELVDRLRQAAEAAGVDILCGARADTLFADADGRISGIELVRPDGSAERVGARALVLACNGYGGNSTLVRRYIPELADALYFGHPGNQGEAVLWGESLGAALRHLSGHQGHGSVAHPHGILITWATIMEGGFQVNAAGRRFSDETRGYSEQAAAVIAQPDGVAYTIFDTRIAAVARQFDDFRAAEAAGAVIRADAAADLAIALGIDQTAFCDSLRAVEDLKAKGGTDRFGRRFAGVSRLEPPYFGVKVTGALFHTQGGLAVDEQARVRRKDGTPLPNLFAAGGAAAGVSGSTAAGYLSGNGLLTAVAYGRAAGRSAAHMAGREGRSRSHVSG